MRTLNEHRVSVESVLGLRTLLGAPGLTTRSKDAISNKGHRY